MKTALVAAVLNTVAAVPVSTHALQSLDLA